MSYKWIKEMFLDSKLSDATLLFPSDSVKLAVHSLFLIGVSPVFEAMFNGKLKEDNSTIEIKDVQSSHFREMLRYIYTEEVNLNDENICGILIAAHKYALDSLVKTCHIHIQTNLKPTNVLMILEEIPSELLDREDNTSLGWKLISEETEKVLQSSYFDNIDRNTWEKILNLQIMNISEATLFEFALQWSKSQCNMKGLDETIENQRLMLNKLVYYFDFTSLTLDTFMGFAFQFPNFFTDSEIAEICLEIFEKSGKKLDKSSQTLTESNSSSAYCRSCGGQYKKSTSYSTLTMVNSTNDIKKPSLRKRKLNSLWNRKLNDVALKKAKNDEIITLENGIPCKDN